ncbi:hypothetical protein FOG51_03838 [Hanseniaspora uvarum]|nr:hypothetical protein FOG51_03838 [Hanseniaspora uvarum]
MDGHYKLAITIELNTARIKAEEDKDYDLLFKILDKSFQLINTELISLEDQLSLPYYSKELPELELIDFTIKLFKKLIVDTNTNFKVTEDIQNEKIFKYLPVINDLLNSSLATSFDNLLPILKTLLTCLILKVPNFTKYLYQLIIEHDNTDLFNDNTKNLMNLISILVNQCQELFRCDSYTKVPPILQFNDIKKKETTLLCDELNVDDDILLKEKYLVYKRLLVTFLLNVSINLSEGDLTLGNHINLGTLLLTKKETSFLKNTMVHFDKIAGNIIIYFVTVLIREHFLIYAVFDSILENLFQVIIQRQQFHKPIYLRLLEFQIDKKWQLPNTRVIDYRVEKRNMERVWKLFIKNSIRANFINAKNGVYNADQWKFINDLKRYYDGKEEHFKRNKKDWRLDQPFFPKEKDLLFLKKNKKHNVLYRLQNNLLKRKNKDLSITSDSKKLKSKSGISQLYSQCEPENQFDMTQIDTDTLLKICLNTFTNDLTFQPILNKLISVSKDYLEINNGVVSKENRMYNPYEEKEDVENSDNEETENEVEVKETDNVYNSKGEIVSEKEFEFDDKEKREQLKVLVQNLFKTQMKHDSLVKETKENNAEIKLLNLDNCITKKPNPNVTLIIRLCSQLDDDIIRKQLQEYIMQHTLDMDNLMVTINYILEWMNNEWLILTKKKLKEKIEVHFDKYYYWLNLTLEDLILKVDNSNKKEFIQLFSGLPLLNCNVFEMHFSKLLLDPYKQQLGYMTLKYILMFRPSMITDVLTFLDKQVNHNTDLDLEVKVQLEQLLSKFNSKK